MSSNTYSGLGGLFGGFQNGLQMLLALQKAEEDRKIRQGELNVNQRHVGLQEQQYADTEADKPYVDIQNQLNKDNTTAPLGAIRAAETPPSVADTVAPVHPFTPPAFGGGPSNDPNAQFTPAPRPRPLGPPLGTSHLEEVLNRASQQTTRERRQHIFELGQGTRAAVRGAAGARAQETQAPVAGSFDVPASMGGGRAELPAGYTTSPDKTFSPWSMGERPDPLDNIFGPMLNNPVQELLLEARAKKDPTGEAAQTLRAYRTWKARRFGGGVAAPTNPSPSPAPTPPAPAPPTSAAPVSTHTQRRAMGTPGYKSPAQQAAASADTLVGGKTIGQWIAAVQADTAFAGATPEEIAAEAKRRAGVR